MHKAYFLFFAGIFIWGSSFSQRQPAPESYIAYKTIDAIEIDGKADETSWQEARFSSDFIDIEGVDTPRYRTNVKMLYDQDYMYFYAKMEEPHVWGTLKQRDTVIFYNNDFEIFIDPDGDTHNYMEFEMNALNTIWDLFIVKPYREPAPIVDSWDIQGLRSAVYIDGSLNDSSDEDNFWSVEVAIPWKVLTEANIHGNIPENEFWRVNFSRVNWEHELTNGTYSRKKDRDGKFLPEYNWVWSPQWVINMHEPERWGYVYFSSEEVGNEDSFSIPKDEHLRWYLYDLYRAQKAHFGKNRAWATSVAELGKELSVEGKTIAPEIEIHKSGWNISLKSPFTGNILLIREDGKFITQSNN